MKNVNMIWNKRLKIAMPWRINSNPYLIVSVLFSFPANEGFIALELHDYERQVPELRKKADDERAKKEAVRKIEHKCKTNVDLGREKTPRNRDESSAK